MKHLNKMEDPSADQTNVLLSAAPSSLSLSPLRLLPKPLLSA